MCKFIALAALGLFIAGSASADPGILVGTYPGGGGWASACISDVTAGEGSVNCFTMNGTVLCAVQDAEGNGAFCTSSDPEHVAAVRGLPDNCGLFFTYDAEGNCTTILTHTGTNSH